VHLIFIGEAKGGGFSGILEFLCEINAKINPKEASEVVHWILVFLHIVHWCAALNTIPISEFLARNEVYDYFFFNLAQQPP
jgi:hypothetical protein